jgi:hypothetical protein
MQKKTTSDALVGGIGADMPHLPGQLELEAHSRRDLIQLLEGFRSWMSIEWDRGSSHIQIAAVHSYFGWPRPGN